MRTNPARANVPAAAEGHAVVSLESNPDLLRAFRRGERKVLVDIYAQFGEVVYRYLRDRLRSAADARDLMQEVFITAFKEETRLRFSGTSSIQSFLLGIARNLLMHHFRADRVREAGADRITRSLDSNDQEVPSVDHALENKEVSKLLDVFMSGLAEREREFFRHHMMERPPRRITAENFAMTEDQVRYLEKKLREKALGYLKKIGYLDAAGPLLRRAAAGT